MVIPTCYIISYDQGLLLPECSNHYSPVIIHKHYLEQEPKPRSPPFPCEYAHHQAIVMPPLYTLLSKPQMTLASFSVQQPSLNLSPTYNPIVKAFSQQVRNMGHSPQPPTCRLTVLISKTTTIIGKVDTITSDSFYSSSILKEKNDLQLGLANNRCRPYPK